MLNPLTQNNPTFEWKDNRDPESPRPSPNAIVGLLLGSTKIMVTYGRPAAKGRKIFGGLVRNETLWRTGANEATTISFNQDLEIGGTLLKAGTYSLFTIPGKNEWTIILNKEFNLWGSNKYAEDKDVLRKKVPSGKTNSFRERLLFDFENIDTENFTADLAISWENTKVVLHIKEL